MKKTICSFLLLGSMGSIPATALSNEQQSNNHQVALQSTMQAPSSVTIQQDIQGILSQEMQQQNFYRVYFDSIEQRNQISISFHAQLMETRDNLGYLILQLDEFEKEQLTKKGITVKPAPIFVEQWQERLKDAHQQSLNASVSATAIPGYSCYETVEETFAEANSLASNYPQLASWIDVGDSWEKTNNLGGYDIRVLVLTNSAITGDKPKLFINSAIHAREYTTAPLNLDFAKWLVEGYQDNADARWILDHHEVHLMLQTNPDGRKRAEAGSSWRKNTNQNYCGATSSSRGADLNRNFTDRWNITNGSGSSGSQCSSTYRGPSAGSEPEIQALENYVRSLWPDRRGSSDSDAAPSDTSGIHIDLHSYSELVLWPWGDKSSPAPNGSALQTLGRKFAFFNGYMPQQSIGLYPTDGTSDNVSYSELGVAAFTFELGTSFFQNCSTYNNTINPDNLPALVYAAKVVRTPYITPSGPDILSLQLSDGASDVGVPAGTSVTLTAQATDTRFSSRNGNESTQSIISAEYFIDVPPWQSGAVAQSINASDGNYNSSTEGLTATIDTSSLSVGEHIVYVRSRDANNVNGAISAVFLKITDGTPSLNADFSFSCNQLACDFDGSSSSGTISSYQWEFGDGNNASGMSTTHTFGAAGTYQVTLTVQDNQGNSDSETQAISVSTEAGDLLQNNVPVDGLFLSQGETVMYRMVVPPNASSLSFSISGGSGDADLYVRFNAEPTQTEYDCRPYRNGNSESCAISNVQSGTYYVMLRAYQAFQGVSLVGQYQEQGSGGEFVELDVAANSGEWRHYPVTIPAGMSNLTATISSGTGDADLYVRRGSQPTTSSYDCRPYRWGNEESCTFSAPQADVWYISVRAYSSFSGLVIRAEWQ